jgi:dimethylglycine dehydrogenase
VEPVIHGPFTFARDSNPLVGPSPGLRGDWSAWSASAGFSQAGGVGLMLAQEMVEGACERDTAAMDVAHHGDRVSPGYALPKGVETCRRRSPLSCPNEALPAAHPNRTTPMHDIVDRPGAVLSARYGPEVPNYRAHGNEPRRETPSFRRSDAHQPTARGDGHARGRRHQRGARFRQGPRHASGRACPARQDHGRTHPRRAPARAAPDRPLCNPDGQRRHG